MEKAKAAKANSSLSSILSSIRCLGSMPGNTIVVVVTVQRLVVRDPATSPQDLLHAATSKG